MSLSPHRAARAAAEVTRAQVERGDGGRSAIKTVGFVVWLLLWSIVVVGSLGPMPAGVPGSDKLQHVIAYGGLAASALLFVRSVTGLLVATVVTVALSGVLEIVQGFVPNRQPDVLDLIANGIGAVCGLAVALAIGVAVRRWRA